MILTVKEMFEELLKAKGIDGVDCSGWNWSGIDVTGVDFSKALNVDDSINDAVDMSELAEDNFADEDLIESEVDDEDDDVIIDDKDDVEVPEADDDELDVEEDIVVDDEDDDEDDEELENEEDLDEDEVFPEDETALNLIDEEDDMQQEIQEMRRRVLEHRLRMRAKMESRRQFFKKMHESYKRLNEEKEEEAVDNEKESLKEPTEQELKDVLTKAFKKLCAGSKNEAQETQKLEPEVAGILKLAKMCDNKEHTLYMDPKSEIIFKGTDKGLCKFTVKIDGKATHESPEINIIELMGKTMNKEGDSEAAKQEIIKVWNDIIDAVVG